MVTNFAITGNTEIIQVAEAVAREKGIPSESIITALEEAVVTVARKKYGLDQHIHAVIDPKTGAIELFRDRAVVEEVADAAIEISVADAIHSKEGAVVGDTISDQLPPIDFGRVTSQTFKQVVIQKVRDAEREKQYEDFKDRVGEIIMGTVKRVEYGNVIVDFGKSETIIPRDQVIPREMFRTNDRVRAYIVDVRRELKGPQIFLSRTHPDFLAQLFAQEVPEIYDKVVQIKGVARDAGSRAKCAVYSNDGAIDPVGSCIGPRGSRVTAVYNELQGEKIDVIQWSPDLATFAVNALTSKTKDLTVEVTKIVIDEDRHVIEAVVPDGHLSLAIGRRGQNVRLASELIGWNIDVTSESEDAQRSMDEFNNLSVLFASSLNVEDVIGQLLASEGFKSIEEVAYVPIEDLTEIEGFDEDIATELQRRASEYLDERATRISNEWKDLGVTPEALELPHVTDEMMVAFGKQGLKTLDNIADLASDEFKEMLPDVSLSETEINELIMKAREHWFEDEKTEEASDSEAKTA
jgi:N utilization substance protein A